MQSSNDIKNEEFLFIFLQFWKNATLRDKKQIAKNWDTSKNLLLFWEVQEV